MTTKTKTTCARCGKGLNTSKVNGWHVCDDVRPHLNVDLRGGYTLGELARAEEEADHAAAYDSTVKNASRS